MNRFVRNKPSAWWFLLPLIIAATHVAYVLHMGPYMAPDSYTYSRWADAMIASRFNPFEFLDRTSFFTPLFMYFGFIYLVAGSKVVFGAEWIPFIVFLNSLLNGVLAWLLLRAMQQLSGSRTASLTVMLLFLVSFEWFQWVRYVLTDISYGVLVFLVLYLLYGVAGKNPRSASYIKHWLLIALLNLLAFYYRPAALPLILLIILAFALSLIDVESRITVARKLSAVIGASIISVILVHALIMHKMATGEIETPPSLEVSLDAYEQGTIIHHRPATYHEPPRDFYDYSVIIFDRILSFFAISTETFSFSHKLYNYLYFIPVYGLVLIAIYGLFHGGAQWSHEALWAGWLSLFFIIFVAVFHSLILIDFDWRYRIPCLPPFLVLAGLGARDLTRQIRAGIGQKSNLRKTAE